MKVGLQRISWRCQPKCQCKPWSRITERIVRHLRTARRHL